MIPLIKRYLKDWVQIRVKSMRYGPILQNLFSQLWPSMLVQLFSKVKPAFVGRILKACSQCSDILRVAKLLRNRWKAKFI